MHERAHGVRVVIRLAGERVRSGADLAQAGLQVVELRLQEGRVEVRRARTGHVAREAGEVVVERPDQRAEAARAIRNRRCLILQRRRGREQRACAPVEAGDQRLPVGSRARGGRGGSPARVQAGAQPLDLPG